MAHAVYHLCAVHSRECKLLAKVEVVFIEVSGENLELNSGRGWEMLMCKA